MVWCMTIGCSCRPAVALFVVCGCCRSLTSVVCRCSRGPCLLLSSDTHGWWSLFEVCGRWTLSLLVVSADVVVVNVVVVEHWCRRCRCERCPTDAEARLATAHLPAQRPATASIYHYWIIDFPPRSLPMSYKSCPFKWTWRFVFWSEQLVGAGGFGVLVLGLWCVARTRPAPPIGNHGAPHPPPPTTPICTKLDSRHNHQEPERKRSWLSSRPNWGGATFATEICISHLLQLGRKQENLSTLLAHRHPQTINFGGIT